MSARSCGLLLTAAACVKMADYISTLRIIATPTPRSARRSRSDATRREIAAPHSAVITRLERNCALGRVIQDSNDRTERPRRTGYPACAGFDDLGMGWSLSSAVPADP